MMAGDIVFVNGNTPISRIVKLIDGGRFSHVAVAVSETHIIEAQYFTKVRITPLKYRDFEVVSVNLSDEQRDKIVHLGIQLVGKWYDYLQVFWYFFNKLLSLDFRGVWNSKNNLICSELVDRLLSQVGYIPENLFLGDVTPSELYEYLKKIDLRK
ncbi:YiiX/YebB-like N1pC/P60 family cysteine hydrolase [Bacillus sp. AIIW2]|uniref:YiiX/YebB-like N1pC/P60 family cysteine hydrolase n=1 Tax=Bacillus sp. AIIW2 TaxID=1811804 RepID=UPI001374B304|nr:YiiX/YebB-like N1pC/P60 family cysteine hydrolase [Bacillus sp. AIIW2]